MLKCYDSAYGVRYSELAGYGCRFDFDKYVSEEGGILRFQFSSHSVLRHTLSIGEFRWHCDSFVNTADLRVANRECRYLGGFLKLCRGMIFLKILSYVCSSMHIWTRLICCLSLIWNVHAARVVSIGQ